MLGEPTFAFGNNRAETESEALLAEKTVAAVAAAEGDDLVLFGYVSDHGHLGVARPVVDNRACRWQRHAHRVQALDEQTRVVLVLVATHVLEHRAAHASHDAHAAHNVGRVGELDADLRYGSAEWSHRVRNDVHGATAHAARQTSIELHLQVLWRHPVAELAAAQLGQVDLGRWRGEAVLGGCARVDLTRRADECARLDARYIFRIGQSQPTTSNEKR